MRMDDSISRQDAIKTVRKTILSLMDGLPTINIDGEEYCADNRLHNAYLEANKAVNNALRKLPSWHTEDPSADVVEVCRCGKCVNWKGDFPYDTCALFGGRWKENMFCSYGERKDG